MNKDLILLPSNRKFGYFFTAIFFVGAVYFYLIDLTGLATLFFLVFTVFLLLSSFFSSILQRLNYCWYVLGIWLGKIVSPIVLGIIFFILISPIAIVLKRFGRDELKLKRSSFGGSTYWIHRTESVSKDSFKDQF